MINFQTLRMVYAFASDLTIKDVNQLIKASGKRVFQKKSTVINIGSYSNEVFFIKKGLVRAFKIDENGEEFTLALYAENTVLTNVDYFLFKEASNYYYEAYEKTTTFSLQYDEVEKIVDRNTKLVKGSQYVLLKIVKNMFRRIESLVLLSPEQRYLKFTKDFPDISNRVPNKFIANILGVTPVSLSRIRKRLTDSRS